MSGTTTPTADQITQVRSSLGVLSAAFSDGQLTAFWATLSGAPNQTIQYRATVALCYENALAQLTNYHDYSTGNTEEKFQQIFKNAMAMYQLFANDLQRVLKASISQVAIGGARGARAQPADPIDNGLDNTYTDWIDRVLSAP